MSPGVNDHPRSTGTLPKSNRPSNRNRERDRSAVNQNTTYSRVFGVPAQHSNNLFQFDWHPVSERQTSSTGTTGNSRNSAVNKNSNARSTHFLASSSYDLPDHLGPYNSHSRPYPNQYVREDSWLNMTPPADSRGQSPPNLSMKPTNTDKMPERGQVEGRLNQIREYIKVTSSMMDSLSQSTDPRAQAQHEKLGRMVEDLYDSEQKLTKLMENCQKYWRLNENGDLENGREQELVKKIEESQRKLAQLQVHQSQLLGMQLSVREKLNEARQAQRLLCTSDEENEIVPENRVNVGNVEQLERETEALRGKLQQLENKKRHMDHLVQELQAVEVSERASCSSEGSRSTAHRDKVSELEAMKAQLTHLKALMNDAMQRRVLEPEHDDNLVSNSDVTTDEVIVENDVNIDTNSYNDLDEVSPDLQQIQAVTRELKEQQQLLQTARAELRRLKTSSTSPPMLIEKKQSNHMASNNDLRLTENKRQQLEDFMRKDKSHDSSVNQNGAPEWSSRRESNRAPTHEHSIDAMSVADNILEMGSQPPIANGFAGNYWEMPNLMNQPPQGANVASAEYYRQLLLGSQAVQLQMMSQLVWNQQREMQSMKAAISQIQAQLGQPAPRTSNNLDIPEEHSNLGRAAAQQHFSSLDPTTLPPSSSLPNLVSLPSTSPAPPSIVSTSTNCQQQQLNNQVPPGNRANNYWDNFRSYSRQNLLSGSSKTATEASAGAPVSSSANTTTIISSHGNIKCNRQVDLENLPSTSDAQYSVNLQQERDPTPVSQNNFATSNEQQQQQQQQQQQLHHNHQQQLQQSVNADNDAILRENEPSSSIGKKIRSDVKVLLKRCLKVLESKPENESSLPFNDDVSNDESADSSDNESEAGAGINEATVNNNNVLVESHLPDFIEPSTGAQVYTSPLPEFLEHEFRDVLSFENNINSLPPVSSTTSSNNDVVMEADLIRPDHSSNHYNLCSNNDVIDSVSTDYENHGLLEIRYEELNVDDEQDREFVMLERAHNSTMSRRCDK